MAPRCGAGHCGCGGRAPPPALPSSYGPDAGRRTWAPPAALSRRHRPGLGVPGAHGSARSDTAAPAPAPAGHRVSLDGLCLPRSLLRCGAAGCSRPSPSPAGPGSLLLPRAAPPRSSRCPGSPRLRVPGSERRGLASAWAAPPRGQSHSQGEPRRRRRGVGFPGLRCLRGGLAVPAVPAPPPPPPAACCGRRAPGPAPGRPRPSSRPYGPAPSWCPRTDGPAPRPPRPRAPPQVGRGPPSLAGRFRAFQCFRNRPGRLLPRRTQIMGSRAAGSSRLGPVTHLVKIAPGTPRLASPRPDRLPGGTAAWEAQPASRSEGRGSRVQGKAGRGSPARGTGDHPRGKWGQSAPSGERGL